MNTIRIVVVDDQAAVRDAIAQTIDAEPDLEVVGRATDAAKGLELARLYQPDVLVLDLVMDGLDPFDAAMRLPQVAPETKVMLLTGSTGDRMIRDASRTGAQAYVTKDEPLVAIPEAIRRVAAGAVWFSEKVRARIAAEGSGEPRPNSMTPREEEVLCLLASGLSKKEIAAKLTRSVKTIENHCSNLMKKLDVHDRVALARYAIREGYLKP